MRRGFGLLAILATSIAATGTVRAQGEIVTGPQGGFFVGEQGGIRVEGDLRTSGTLSVEGTLEIRGDLHAESAHFGAQSVLEFEGDRLHRCGVSAPNVSVEGMALDAQGGVIAVGPTPEGILPFRELGGRTRAGLARSIPDLMVQARSQPSLRIDGLQRPLGGFLPNPAHLHLSSSRDPPRI